MSCFLYNLQSPEDVDIRTKILSKIKQCPNITLQEVNLKHDTSMIKNTDDGLKKKHNQSQPVTGRESLCNYSEQSVYRIVVVVIIVIVFRDY